MRKVPLYVPVLAAIVACTIAGCSGSANSTNNVGTSGTSGSGTNSGSGTKENSRGRGMAKLTPAQEARYALRWKVSRSGLPAAAQLDYARLQAETEREAAAVKGPR